MKMRKMYTVIDEARSNGDVVADTPLRKVAVVAIVKNPYAGRYVEDLQPLIDASPALGQEMAEQAMAAMAPYSVASYGKGVVVGINGEQDHGIALVTTAFGNVIREAAGGGKAWISSFSKRGGPGTTIDIPLAHKDACYVRDNYDGITLNLPDGPMPDEIAVICAYANRGRLNARVGGLKAEDIVGEDGLV